MYVKSYDAKQGAHKSFAITAGYALGEIGDVIIASEATDDRFAFHKDEYADMGYTFSSTIGYCDNNYVSGYDDSKDPKTFNFDVALKVVQHGKAQEVHNLEDVFLSRRKYYYQIKNGVSVGLPRKGVSIAYNILLILSAIFLMCYLFFTPRLFNITFKSSGENDVIGLTHYKLSLDIYLFSFIPQYSEIVNSIPIGIVYASLFVGLVCIIASMILHGAYFIKKFGMLRKNVILMLYLIISIIQFIFALIYIIDHVDDEDFILFSILIHSALRLMTIVLLFYMLINGIYGLCAMSPYSQILDDCKARNEYFVNGGYRSDQELLKRICDYNENVDVVSVINHYKEKCKITRWGERRNY